MTKIISLRGEPIRDKPEIDSDMIQILEEQLEMAKAGQLVGVAVVCATRSGSVLPRWRILMGGAYPISAGLSYLQAQLMKFLDSKSTSP